jgi:hypothetical protein
MGIKTTNLKYQVTAMNADKRRWEGETLKSQSAQWPPTGCVGFELICVHLRSSAVHQFFGSYGIFSNG